MERKVRQQSSMCVFGCVLDVFGSRKKTMFEEKASGQCRFQSCGAAKERSILKWIFAMYK